jgi:hypothetical protein
MFRGIINYYRTFVPRKTIVIKERKLSETRKGIKLEYEAYRRKQELLKAVNKLQ